MPVYADPFGSFVDGFRQGEQDKRAADKAGGSGSSGRGSSGGGGKTTGDTPVPNEDDSTASKTTVAGIANANVAGIANPNQASAEAAMGRPGLPAMTGDMNQYPDEASRRSGGVNPFDVRQNPLAPGAASPEVQAMPPAIVPGAPIMDLQAYLNTNTPEPVFYPQGFPEMPQPRFSYGPARDRQSAFAQEYNRTAMQPLDQLDRGNMFGNALRERTNRPYSADDPNQPFDFGGRDRMRERDGVRLPLGPQDFGAYERYDRPDGRYDRNPFLPFGRPDYGPNRNSFMGVRNVMLP